MFLLAALCVTAVVLLLAWMQRQRRMADPLYLAESGSAAWSPDGRYLFYITRKYNTIRRLAIATRHLRRYRVPEQLHPVPGHWVLTAFCPASSGETLYLIGPATIPSYLRPLYRWDLVSDTVERIAPVISRNEAISWLIGDRLLIYPRHPATKSSIFAATADDPHRERLVSDVYFVAAATDGSGFLYRDGRGYAFYDAGAHRSRRVDLPDAGTYPPQTLKVFGLAGSVLTYKWGDSQGRLPWTILNLNTGAAQRFHSLSMMQENTISPSYNAYWVSEWPQSHYDRFHHLYLHRMPSAMLEAYRTLSAE
jgi:hypothetical protein